MKVGLRLLNIEVVDAFLCEEIFGQNVLPAHDIFIIISGLCEELVHVMHKEFEKMFSVPFDIYDNAKVILVSLLPEAVDMNKHM